MNRCPAGRSGAWWCARCGMPKRPRPRFGLGWPRPWRSLGRLKGRPLSLTPMYVQRDDHATGLIRLLSIALRVVTLLEFVVRRQVAAAGAKLAGLYAGNSKRETGRPTAERLLEAFQDITL